MDRFELRFELRPLGEVLPWGQAEDDLRLHWFGLTDGWYDVVVGGRRLFAVAGDDSRGIDYQVVRLWEDLIEVAPFVLADLPEPLVARVARGDAWDAWCAEAMAGDDGLDELTEQALGWWWHHQLDSGHLQGAPVVHFHRHGDDVHVRWRSSPPAPDGPAWPSPHGDAVVSARDFLAELTRFDRALIAAMGDRVEQVAAGGLRPAIAIDVDQLRREHADRALWLERSLTAGARGAASWDVVVAALLALERRVAAQACQRAASLDLRRQP